METENKTFEEKVNAIKKDRNKVFTVTPWEITNYFKYQHRSLRLAEIVNKFLNDNELELSSDFYQANFYANLTLQHKKVATTKVETDPVKRVVSLAAATSNKVVCVDKNSSLEHAITLMQQYGYSRLPVTSGSDKYICGYISWEIIGTALWHKKEGDKVKDYMSKEITIIQQNAPLLETIRTIASKKFVVVIKEDKTPTGIITSSDIANEFFSITQSEAFLLLEQIELYIRMMIGRAGILLEDLQKFKYFEEQNIESIDDLAFGQYCRLFEDEQCWNKFQIKNDHSDFVKFMNEVGEIRNRVMHFEPEGIGRKNIKTLRNMARYLTEVWKIKEAQNSKQIEQSK